MTLRTSGEIDGAGRPPAAAAVLRTTALVLLPVLALAVFWLGQKAFFLLFAGVLFAAVLDAATRGVGHATGLSRRWAYALTLGVLVLALAALGWYGGRTLLAQAEQLYAALEAQARRIGDLIDHAQPGSQAGEPETLARTLRDLGRMFGGEGTGAGTMAQAALGALANAFLVFFIGVFLALNPGLYKNGAVRLFPVRLRTDVDAALHAAGETLRRWLVGKLMSMALIAGLTAAGLLLVGYPLAVPLALLAGGLAFVPNLGPLLTYVPIALAGASAGVPTMLTGVAAYAVAQAVESYVFTPLIQKRMVSLAPALILFSQVLGGILFGLWGVALATPLAAVLLLWVRGHYVEGVLEGERPEGPERPEGRRRSPV